MEELISVIIPVYGAEKYLHKCVDSLINQTYKNLEIILVDDGSPDNCGKICDEYAKKDSRIRVIHKENGGQASARNMGLDIAKGEYIGFADSDDWIFEDMYEYLYNGIKSYNADIAVCGMVFGMDRKKNVRCGRIYTTNDTEVMDTVQTLKAHLDVRFGFSPCNKLYSRRLWNELRFPICFREDEAVMYKVLAKAAKTVFMTGYKYFYVWRKGSTERSGYSEKWLISNKTTDEMYEFIKQNYPELEKDAWDNRIKIRIDQINNIVRYGDVVEHGAILNDMLDFLKKNKAYSDILQQKSEYIIHHQDEYFKTVKRNKRKQDLQHGVINMISRLGLDEITRKIWRSVKGRK